jgi:hypothetical protein
MACQFTPRDAAFHGRAEVKRPPNDGRNPFTGSAACYSVLNDETI